MRSLKISVLLVTMLFFIVSVPLAIAADDTACYKKTTTRGVGTVPICSSNMQMDAGLCYTPCPAGFNGVGPVCWKPCPAGYKNDGATCRKDAEIITKDSYGRGVGRPMPCRDDYQDRQAGLCYKNCKEGYKGVGPVCWRFCTEGFTDDGATCRKNAHIFSKESKPRGVGLVPKTCPAKKVMQHGLCYAPCPSGFKGVGPVCWKSCTNPNAKVGSVQMPTECGAGCTTTKQSCATFTQQLTAAGLKVAGDIVIAIATADPAPIADIPDQLQKFLDVPYCE